MCSITVYHLNPSSVNPTKWSNTLKQFVGKLPTNCLSVSDHFVGLALKGLMCHRVFCHFSVNGSTKYTQFLKYLKFTSDTKSISDFNKRYVPRYPHEDAIWTKLAFL